MRSHIDASATFTVIATASFALFTTEWIYERLVTSQEEYKTTSAKFNSLKERQQALKKLEDLQTGKEKNEYQSNLTCLRNLKRSI